MLASDLVRRQVAVLAAFAPPSVVAAKSATTTIPIIFSMGGDPVKLGIVASLNRPGGNISGISMLTVELLAKRLGLMREMVPSAKSFGFLVNPAIPTANTQTEAIGEAAHAVGLKLRIERARDELQLEQPSRLSPNGKSAHLLSVPTYFSLVGAKKLCRSQQLTLSQQYTKFVKLCWREA